MADMTTQRYVIRASNLAMVEAMLAMTQALGVVADLTYEGEGEEERIGFVVTAAKAIHEALTRALRESDLVFTSVMPYDAEYAAMARSQGVSVAVLDYDYDSRGMVLSGRKAAVTLVVAAWQQDALDLDVIWSGAHGEA